MKNGLPETLEEFCDYIVEHASRIYVREQIDGKWGSFALTELPADKALSHALGFIKRDFIPHRLKKEGE